MSKTIFVIVVEYTYN